MPGSWIAGSAAALITCVAFAGSASGEVVLFPQDANGNPIVADAIEKQDATSFLIRIYGPFTMAISKAGVGKVVDHASDYAEYAPPIKPATGREPPEPLTAARRAVIDAWIAKYFAAGADKAKVLDALRADDALPWSAVDGVAASIFTAARAGLKLKPGDQTFAHPDFPGEVHVEVFPENAAGKLPLFMVLHGGGEGVGDWRQDGTTFTAIIKKKWTSGVIICPTVLHKKYAEWAGNVDEEAYCKELLKAAKRSWSIDTNQVYLGGYSMGGYGTWHMGAHQADVFAGLVAGAGGILIRSGDGETWGWGVLGNLEHVPIAFLHGTADREAPVWSDQAASKILEVNGKAEPGSFVYKYIECPGADHSGPYPRLAEAIPWALGHSRDPSPKRIAWEPSRPFVRQFYWLAVDKPKFFTSIVAERKDNLIEMTVKRLAGGFSVLLDSRMIDISKPVTVTVNGTKAFSGTVQPSLATMLESIDDKIDEAMWYPARISFAAAGK